VILANSNIGASALLAGSWHVAVAIGVDGKSSMNLRGLFVAADFAEPPSSQLKGSYSRLKNNFTVD